MKKKMIAHGTLVLHLTLKRSNMTITSTKPTYVKKHFNFTLEHEGKEYTGQYITELGPEGEVYDEEVFFDNESDRNVDYDELADYVLEHIFS